MGKLAIQEESSAPSTPSQGVVIYPTVATPSILRVIDDAGTDRALALYAISTWTPGVSFGAGTTGITYTTRVGRYVRMGDLVVAHAYILLSSKGSSTGTALLTGLPVASANVSSAHHAVSLWANTLSSISGSLHGYIAAGATTVSLEFLGTGTMTTMNDTHFNNASAVMVTATYLVA